MRRSRGKGSPDSRPAGEGNVVYVSFGGGGDEEMDAALGTAIEALGCQGDMHLAVANAPLYRGLIPRSPNITPVDYYPMAELYPAFDAAVSAAGYNTAMELVHHGVPTAFVPSRARWMTRRRGRAASRPRAPGCPSPS